MANCGLLLNDGSSFFLLNDGNAILLNDSSCSVEPLLSFDVGSSISGGTFSRGRWRRIRSDLHDQELEEERQRKLKLKKDREWKKYVEENRPFSRAKYAKLQKELLAKQQELERQKRLEIEAEAERKRLADEKRLQEYIAPIQALGAGWQEQAKQLHLINSLQAIHSAQALNQRMLEEAYRLRLAHQAAEDDDEEEAIALLHKLNEDT